MRIICISDTHNKLDRMKIPDGDILLHAGDATMSGRLDEIIKFNQDLGNIKNVKTKICIAGNHDWLFEKDNRIARSCITNAIYLEDEMVSVEGLNIYGSPWQPRFYDWAFNLDRGKEIRKKWNMIPMNTDILITHGPAYGILDSVGPNRFTTVEQKVGCEELRIKIDKMPNLKLHVAGHIHLQHGQKMNGKTMMVNAASLDDHYQVAHEPIVIDL